MPAGCVPPPHDFEAARGRSSPGWIRRAGHRITAIYSLMQWGRAAWGSAQPGSLWRALKVIPRGVRATLAVRVCSLPSVLCCARGQWLRASHGTSQKGFSDRPQPGTGSGGRTSPWAGLPALGGPPHLLSLVSCGVVGILDPFLGGKLYCKCLRQVPAHTQLTQKELL